MAHLTGKWKVTLDPVEAGGPYTVIASMDQLSVNLTDVLFGEVWLCSGQSNMCFETEKVCVLSTMSAT